MRSNKRWLAMPAIAAVAVAGAACGSSGGSSASGGGDVGDFGDPLTIATLWEVSGESSFAISDYENGAQMAIEEINEAGGVGGQPVESFRVPVSVADMQAAQSSFLEAVDKDPDVMVGLTTPSQLEALAPRIIRAEIPIVATHTGEPSIRKGDTSGTDYTWISKTYDPSVVAAGVDYLVDELGLDSIGVMATNESYGQQGIAAATAALEDKGQKPFATAEYPPTATDLTTQVLQMKGSNAVIDWGFPNTIPVQLQQFIANGMDIPTLASDSASIAVASGLVSGPAIDELYVASACNPDDPSTPELTDFTSEYEERYGQKATASAGLAYDAVYIAVEAARIANSSDPAAINEAMPQVERPDGVCGSYKADGAHMLNHQAVISKFSADGTNKTLVTVKVEDQDEQ